MMKQLLAMRGKLSFCVAIIILTTFFTGCGSSTRPYARFVAKDHVYSWLKSKYGEDFKVGKIEKRSYGNANGKNYYYYEAVSQKTGVTFDGTTSYTCVDGIKGAYVVSDKYEEALYKDKMLDEIAAIPNTLDKYGTLECDILATDSRYSKFRSNNYNDFRSNTSKVHINLAIHLDGEGDADMMKELYKFTHQVYDINKDVCLTVYRDNDENLASVRTKDVVEFDYKYFLDCLS